MPAIRRAVLPPHRTHTSPAGVAAIRELLAFPAGEISHAAVPASAVSHPSRVYPNTEWYYVLRGTGSLWDGEHDRVLPLEPGHLVRIAPGTLFQYRAEQPLEFLVVVVPRWRPENYYLSPVPGRWPSTGEPGTEPVDEPSVTGAGITIYTPHATPDLHTPDGFDLWHLGHEPSASLALGTLPAGKVTLPVRHKTIEDLWYVLDGKGQISRRDGNLPVEIDELTPGTCVDIGTGITFQVRSHEPLTLLLLTLPAWPGPDERTLQPGQRTW